MAGCAWIEGDPRDVRERGWNGIACGADVVEGSPYCCQHHERAYVRRAVAAVPDDDDEADEPLLESPEPAPAPRPALRTAKLGDEEWPLAGDVARQLGMTDARAVLAQVPKTQRLRTKVPGIRGRGSWAISPAAYETLRRSTAA